MFTPSMKRALCYCDELDDADVDECDHCIEVRLYEDEMERRAEAHADWLNTPREPLP